MSNARSPHVGGRLRWAGLFGLVAALSICLMPGIADAKKGKKKKQDTVNVLSYNLYLGSDLADATNAGLASRTDLFADEVGEVLSEVNGNDFTVRAKKIAADIKKHKVDLVGLQEAALWKLEVPTDGGGPPRGTPAAVPLIDYIDTLLNELNAKAKTKKQCGQAAKDRKAKGKKPKPCFRGYTLVGAQQQADVEQLGDFDSNAGPDGKTCDLSSGTCPNPYPSGGGGGGSDAWLWGNDDTPGVNLQDPPAAQCSDGIDNDNDGLVDWGVNPVTNETSGPSPGFFAGNPAPPGPYHCNTRLDNSESATSLATDPGYPLSGPQSFPQDANMDNHAYTGDVGVGVAPDALGNGLDPAAVSDCAPSLGDTNPDLGPAVGADPDGGGPAPAWNAPNFNKANVPVCVFHGIDGDIRLQMRDVILKRNGAGVKTSNVVGGNFTPASTFTVTVFGQPLRFSRGWVQADVSVRGKKFRLVNTHLESESNGSVREDQASELIAPGGPASAPNTVLIGDLNSDPARAPTNLPDGDGGSNIAINRLLAGGFKPVEVPGFSGGHGELLSDLGNTLSDGRIDHILTNGPSISLRSGAILDGQIAGLWASDHGGVLSRLAISGGKKKGSKKKK